MMSPILSAWTAVLLCGLCTAVHADDTALDARMGLPRLSQNQGETLAWRELRLRLDHDAFSLEARLPSCLAQSANGDHSAARCSTGNLSRSAHPLSRELRAAWQGEPLWADGPAWLLTGLAWHTPGAADQATDHGSQAELEISQALGAWSVWLGQSLPLNSALADDRWRSQFAGLEWTASSGHRIELSADLARNTVTGERDREVLLSWRVDVAPATRARLQWVRQLDDASVPWRVSTGLDWRF
jgi:hypothetical protein